MYTGTVTGTVDFELNRFRHGHNLHPWLGEIITPCLHHHDSSRATGSGKRQRKAQPVCYVSSYIDIFSFLNVYGVDLSL